MKKRLLLPISLLGLFTLIGCSTSTSSSSSEDSSSTSSSTSSENGNTYDYNEEVSIVEASDIEVEETTAEFAIETSDGEYEVNNSVYTIKKAGTYTLSGKLVGQVLVEAGDEDEVIIELNNTSISYSKDAPIKINNASNVEISALKDTSNLVTDNRSNKTTDVDGVGEGAIYSDVDLKLKGSGTLVVTGNYNNGIHSTKDLKIQKETLKVTAYNNALRGKNSVTIESGTIQLYANTGNGIKTISSEVTSKGNQKGVVTINGGNIYIDSLHDAIDASYDVEVNQVDSAVSTQLVLKTGTKSSVYSKSSFSSSSEKGIKASNEIRVNAGTIQIAASDDAIHANYGDTLENGNKGQGNITINGGLIQVASGDDGLHADNTLTVNGGKVVVTGATEGYEANYIVINGGYSYIYGTDDGVNCSKKSFNSCSFTINDGYLDVAVSNGDTDGIDSNGDLYIKGGTIVTRGAPGTGGGMSTGLDVDGTCSMTGGTLIAFNGLERTPSTSSGIYYASTSGATSGGMGNMGGMPPRRAVSSSSFAAGTYTLTGGDLNLSFTNDYQYSSFLIYSSVITSGTTYTLSRNGSTLLSWAQSSSSVTIS